jgi:hypothetical protein
LVTKAWDSRPVILFSNWTFAVIVLNIHSDERMGLSFTIAAGPRQRTHSQVRVPAGLMTTFYRLRFETPPNRRARSPYLYPPGTRGPDYTPGQHVAATNKTNISISIGLFLFLLLCWRPNPTNYIYMFRQNHIWTDIASYLKLRKKLS